MLNQFNHQLSANSGAPNQDTQAPSDPEPTIFHFLSDDIFEETIEYLAPEDIAHLRSVCKSLKLTLDSPSLDVLWQPHLNRLRDMDKQIVSALNPVDLTSKRFVMAFKQINQRQVEEISHFIEKVQSREIVLPPELSNHLLSLVAQPCILKI